MAAAIQKKLPEVLVNTKRPKRIEPNLDGLCLNGRESVHIARRRMTGLILHV